MSTTTALPQLYSYGHALEMSDDKVGLLRDSRDAMDDVAELHRRFDTDGYLYIKGGLDRDEVLAARQSLVDGLGEAGVLDESHPRMDGVCKPGSGYVFKPELTNNNPAIQKLLYSGNIPAFYQKFYGEEIRHYDFTWLRDIIATHRDETGSAVAERILSDWSQQVNHFVKVMPREYKKVLLAISEAEKAGKDVDTAIMEAARG